MRKLQVKGQQAAQSLLNCFLIIGFKPDKSVHGEQNPLDFPGQPNCNDYTQNKVILTPQEQLSLDENPSKAAEQDLSSAQGDFSTSSSGSFTFSSSSTFHSSRHRKEEEITLQNEPKFIQIFAPVDENQLVTLQIPSSREKKNLEH